MEGCVQRAVYSELALVYSEPDKRPTDLDEVKENAGASKLRGGGEHDLEQEQALILLQQ